MHVCQQRISVWMLERREICQFARLAHTQKRDSIQYPAIDTNNKRLYRCTAMAVNQTPNKAMQRTQNHCCVRMGKKNSVAERDEMIGPCCQDTNWFPWWQGAQPVNSLAKHRNGASCPVRVCQELWSDGTAWSVGQDGVPRGARKGQIRRLRAALFLDLWEKTTLHQHLILTHPQYNCPCLFLIIQMFKQEVVLISR